MRKLNIYDVPEGTSLRQLEHDQTLLKSVNFFSNLIKISKLFMTIFFNLVGKFLTPKIKEKFDFFISRYLSLRSNDLVVINSKFKQSDKEIIQKSIIDYKFIHENVNNFCLSNDIKFFHFFQPLVFFGEKKLTIDENIWKKNGYSSGDPEIFAKFYNSLKKEELNIKD